MNNSVNVKNSAVVIDSTGVRVSSIKMTNQGFNIGNTLLDSQKLRFSDSVEFTNTGFKVGNITLNSGGLRFSNNFLLHSGGINLGTLVFNANGINAGSKRVSNLADAQYDQDAVTYQQLKAHKIPYVSIGPDYMDSTNRKSDGATNWATIAMGVGASAAGHTALSLGYYAKGDATEGISIGSHAQSSRLRAIAIGSGAKAGVEDSTFLACPGCGNTIAIGTNAHAAGNQSISLGAGAKSTKELGIAIGVAASTSDQRAVALGWNTNASGLYSAAIGEAAKADKQRAVAIGNATYASGEISIAIGEAAKTTDKYTVAMGSNASASKEYAVAFGRSANAAGARAATLGFEARTSSNDAVALGSFSFAEDMQFTDEAKWFKFKSDNGQLYNTYFDGTASNVKGAISVGQAADQGNRPRQIHNVAAGRLNARSRDAVNGSQLYAVVTQSGFNILQNTTNRSRVNNNGTVTFSDGDLTKAIVTDGDNASTIKFDVVKGKLTTDNRANTTATTKGVALAEEVATSLNVVRNTPITFTGNSGTSAAKKLGDSISITGGNGLTSVASTNGIEVRIDDETRKKIDRISAPDLTASVSATGALTVKNNGTTSVNNTNVTNYEIDLSTQTKAEIKKGVDAYDTVTTKGLTFTGDSGTSAVKKLGESVAIKGDNNIKTIASADGVQVTLNKDITADSVKTGDVSFSKDGINAGDKKITGVADGDISPTSKEAVNGSQLDAVVKTINNSMTASRTEVKAGKNVSVDVDNSGAKSIYTVNAHDTSAKVEGAGAIKVTAQTAVEVADTQNPNHVATVTTYKLDLTDNIKKEMDDSKNTAQDALTTAQKGWNLEVQASDGKVESIGVENVKPDETLILDAGKNIAITHKQGRKVTIAMDGKPEFDSITTKGDININGTIHANGGLTVAQNQVVNMGGNQVTNVAEGVKPTDAVNKAQLDRVAGETVRQVGRVERKIDQVDRKLRAGIAGATAIAFLQQPSVGGKSLVSMSVGGYRNQQAVAVGYGRNSDNNKVTFKVGGSVNSQGDMNWGGSVGYQW